MGLIEFLIAAPVVAVAAWLVARPKRMLYPPPEGWYWEYDPGSGHRGRFRLIRNDGEVFGSFSAYVYASRLGRYFKSREIVRMYRRLPYTGDPLLDGFRIKGE